VPGLPCSAWPYSSKNSRSAGHSAGSASPLPETAERVGRAQAAVGVEFAFQVSQYGALAFLHGADDRDEQALLGAEVVDQHAVAGADGGGQPAQAEVADPPSAVVTAGQLVDDGRQ